MNELEKEAGYFERYAAILVPTVALSISVAILFIFWWGAKIGAHFYQTGNFIEPEVRIVKTETYKPLENDKGDKIDRDFQGEEYVVQYKTLDDGYWKVVCYNSCSLKFLDNAQDRARFVMFMLKKHGTPYDNEHPQFNKIEVETVIPYKGEK